MNLLNFAAHVLSGLLAGYASWLSLRDGGTPWSLGDGFLGTLLTSGVFSACFIGSMFALVSYGNEMNHSKALRIFSSGSAIGLAIPMLGTAVFSLVFDIMGLASNFPYVVFRGFWWLSLAFSLSLSRGVLLGNAHSGVIAFLGLTPGFLFSGLLLDKFFIPNEAWLLGSLVFGLVAGISMGFTLELLKGAWLELSTTAPLKPQFILESDEFTAGGTEMNDMTIEDGPEHFFVISEKDGVHFLEVLCDEPLLIVGRGRFRYRALNDGDVIQIGVQSWIYHNRMVRSRDAVPEAV